MVRQTTATARSTAFGTFLRRRMHAAQGIQALVESLPQFRRRQPDRRSSANQKIWSQWRPLQPLRCRREGSHRSEHDGHYQHPAQQTEDRAQHPINRAQASLLHCPARDSSGKAEYDQDSKKKNKKTANFAEPGRFQMRCKPVRQAMILPGSQQVSDGQAGQTEGFAKKALNRRPTTEKTRKPRIIQSAMLMVRCSRFTGSEFHNRIQ